MCSKITVNIIPGQTAADSISIRSASTLSEDWARKLDLISRRKARGQHREARDRPSATGGAKTRTLKDNPSNHKMVGGRRACQQSGFIAEK